MTFDELIAQIAATRLVSTQDIILSPEDAGVLLEGISKLKANLGASEEWRKLDRETLTRVSALVDELRKV